MNDESHIKVAFFSKPIILSVIAAGAFCTGLDQTVVVTALPSVMLDLNIALTELDKAAWIITAYLVGYTIAIPIIGRLADVYGFARVYQISLAVFAAGSLLIAISPNVGWAISGRSIQAIGGAATIPIGMALASVVLAPKHRGLAIGIVLAAAETGSMLGPAYGGAIIESLSWRWIFWLNIPQSLLLILTLLWLPNYRQPEAKVDYIGGILLAGTLLLFTLLLSSKDLFSQNLTDPIIIGSLALLLSVALVFVETRHKEPLLAPIIFKSRTFVSASIVQFIEGGTLVIAMVTIPLMATTVMGRDTLTVAWWMLRLTGAIPVGAVIGGLLMPVAGIRTIAAVGLALSALGMFLISGWATNISDPLITLHLVVVGLGFGLNNAPIMTRALTSVGLNHRATVASLVTASRMLGMTLGLAALSAWGMVHFQGLTSGIELPIPSLGDSADQLLIRQQTFNQELTSAGLSLFHTFLRLAGMIALIGIIPVIAMTPSMREKDTDDTSIKTPI